jgi:hypothetical protein
MPIRIGESIKIAFNFNNLEGMVDFRTIKWHQPIIEITP